MKPNKLLKKLMVLMTLFFLGFSYQTIAQTMMPISTHSSSYAGYVRGYWFIAPTDFTITGLKIPTEAGTGTQNIQVMKIHSGGVAVYSTEGINFTTLFYVNNAPNNVIQSTAITVNAGDTIGILGQAGNSNSYSPSMNPSFSSTIAGMPVELSRFIYQGEITAGEAPWYSSELSGSLGRVEMYYTTAPCAGQPTAGTVPATIATCPSQPFIIQATGATAAGSMANKWQQSPAGQNTWTDVAGATMSTFGSSGITTATDYRYITTCTPSALSDTSDVVSVTILPSSACYCEPIHTYGCSNGAQVGGVTTTLGLTNISNTNTGCGSLTSIAYSDYSATHSASAAHSNLVNIKVDVSNYSGGVKIWVDWNQNGIFEANELVGESASTISSGSFYQTNFTVPSTAVVGTTKMRVRVVESTTTFDACSTQSYGEAEDYGFVVIQGTPCAGMPSIDTIQGPTDVCALDPFSLSMTPIFQTDISYVWQSSPAGTNTWTNITGATQALYSATNGITTATDYRLIVTCTNSNLSDTTDVKEVGMTPVNQCYCEPSSLYGEYTSAFSTTNAIQNVNFTASSAFQYQNLSGTDTIIAEAGSTFDISHTYVGGSNTVRVWVDWDENGVFDPVAEEVYSNYISSASQTGTITIPTNTPNGSYRLRVRSRWSTSVFGPCTVESYGSAIDYTLKVQGLCTDPIVNLGPNVTICAGETITLDAGNAGLDFEWNDNSTGQTLEVSASGTYYVTVSEDDCSTTDSVVVTVQDLPIVDLGGDVSICEGESITLDAGNTGADFEWSNNSTGQTLDVTAEGTYSVTVTEGTCFASDTVAVSFIDAPT